MAVVVLVAIILPDILRQGKAPLGGGNRTYVRSSVAYPYHPLHLYTPLCLADWHGHKSEADIAQC